MITRLPLEIPASYSSADEARTRMAISAWGVPVIMFLMKSRWSGASMIVKLVTKWNFEVSNFHREISMVQPRSRSALSLSSNHAYLNPELLQNITRFCGVGVGPMVYGLCFG